MVKIIRHDDGVWTTAQAKHAGKPYYVETRHHEQPKTFGIQNGKISKLFIYAGTNWDEKRCVCAYDHGWSKQPETRAANAISNEIGVVLSNILCCVFACRSPSDFPLRSK